MTGKAAAKGAATTVDALLASMKRRRLLWELHLGTVSTAANGTTSGVLLDGDTNTVPAQSLLGDLPQGQRVVVFYVPPAGYYVAGWVGDPPVAANEAYGSVAVAAGGGVPVTQAVVYPALAGSGTVYAWVTVNTGGPGTVVTGESITGSTTPTGLTVVVTRTGAVVNTNCNWLAKRKP